MFSISSTIVLLIIFSIFSLPFLFFSLIDSSSYASNIESFSNDLNFLLLLLISFDCLKSFVFLSPAFFPCSLDNKEFFEGSRGNLTKLDLTLCEGSKVEISITVKINDNLDKYNPKSGYYNDICYKVTSQSRTDISLKDRRSEFVENNMTLCEENCDLINYDYTNEKVKCSCDIKININPN